MNAPAPGTQSIDRAGEEGLARLWGDVVLVKGSRGVGLEVVAPALAVAEAPRG